MNDLYFKQMPVGPMANYVYMIGSQKTREVLLVDPAWDVQKLLDTAAADGYKVTGALITHYHPDHCGGHLFGHDIDGLSTLMTKCPVPVYANKHEVAGLIKVTGLAEKDFKTKESGESLKLGDVEVQFIHTPGHTPGSQCFLVGDRLVSGDTLFINGCGRVDLPGANPAHMYESLTQKLAKIDDNVMLFPGHNYGGEQSTMGREKKNNPYLRMGSLHEWMSMMG